MNIEQQVKSVIEAAIPGATAQVRGGGGHFEIEVTSAAFAGKLAQSLAPLLGYALLWGARGGGGGGGGGGGAAIQYARQFFSVRAAPHRLGPEEDVDA
jgi:hypothetical protein